MRLLFVFDLFNLEIFLGSRSKCFGKLTINNNGVHVFYYILQQSSTAILLMHFSFLTLPLSKHFARATYSNSEKLHTLNENYFWA